MGNTKAKNNSNKPKQTGKTVTSVKKQNTVEYVIVNILCLFVFIAFAYIAIMSFVQTSVFDSANYGSEVILYQTDNIALNILFTSLFTVFIFKMKKHCDFFAKVNLKYMHIGLAAFVMQEPPTPGHGPAPWHPCTSVATHAGRRHRIHRHRPSDDLRGSLR